MELQEELLSSTHWCQTHKPSCGKGHVWSPSTILGPRTGQGLTGRPCGRGPGRQGQAAVLTISHMDWAGMQESQ